MAGPWEDYKAASAPAASDGPWKDYSAPRTAGFPAPQTPSTPGRSDTDIAVGGVKAAAYETAKEVAGLGDMFIDGLTSVVPSGMNFAANKVRDLVSGQKQSPAVVEERRKEFTQVAEDWSPHFLTRVVNLFKPADVKDEPTKVQGVMQKVMDLTDRQAEDWEDKTGGLIKADDLKSLRDFGMNLLGAKAGFAGMGKLGEHSSAPPPKAPGAGMSVETADEVLNRFQGEPDRPTPPPPPAEPPPPTAAASRTDFPPTGERTGSRDAVDLAKIAPREKPAVLPTGEIYGSAEQIALDEKARRGGLAGTADTAEGGTLREVPKSPLDSGMAKVKGGNSWDLTSEEKIALRGLKLDKLPGSGIIVPAVGATAIGLGLYYSDNDGKKDLASSLLASGMLIAGKGKGLSFEEVAGHADTAPLGVFLDKSAYTLNTLEMLPKSKFEFTKDSIRQLLKRQEVTGAERGVFENALAGDEPTITAKRLMAGVKIATGDWELEKSPTHQYADYGLEAIERRLPDDNFDYTEEDVQNATIAHNPHTNQYDIRNPDGELMDSLPGLTGATPEDILAEWRGRSVTAMEGPSATTSVWRLPEHLKLGRDNHFSDPRYFAHTRSFEENGIKHVVEIQSDLAQKAGKVLGAEERARLTADKAELDRQSLVAEEVHSVVNDERSTTQDYVAALNKLEAAFSPRIWEDIKMRLGKTLRDHSDPGSIDPAKYAHYRALSKEGNYGGIFDDVKNDLAKADTSSEVRHIGFLLEGALYKESRRLDVLRAETNAKLAESGKLEAIHPLLKNWHKRLVREELADSSRPRLNPEYEAEQRAYGRTRDTVEQFRASRGRLHPEQVARYDENLRQRFEKLQSIPKELPPQSVVRFATADTVAKVEGWPEESTTAEAKRRGMSDVWERDYQDASARILREHQNWLEVSSRGDEESLAKIRKQMATATANVAKAKKFGYLFNNPDHAGLYVRYAEDVEKFLNQLGGKPHTDSSGHTWIEVPTQGAPKLKAGPRTQMFGAADPKAMLGLSLGIGSAVVAAHFATKDKLEAAIDAGLLGASLLALPRYAEYVKSDWKSALIKSGTVVAATAGLAALDKDHPAEGAMLGILWGMTKMLPKAVVPMVGDLTIDQRVALRDAGIATRVREAAIIRKAIETIVPDQARREAISRAVDRGDLSGLSESEKKAAAAYRNYTNMVGEAAMSAGVLHDFLDNYVTHVVEREGAPRSKIGEVLDALFPPERAGSGTSPKSGFAKQRKYATFDELQTALEGSGLRVKTLDIGEIAQIYGLSMGRAVENKVFIDSLKLAREPREGGVPYVMEVGKAPANYRTVESPQMRGMAVHPDLAPALKFTLEGRSRNELVNGALSLSMAQKRLAVGLSYFHSYNLGLSYVGAGFGKAGAEVAATAADLARKAGGPRREIAQAIERYYKGGAGDEVDHLIRGGLKAERPIESDPNALSKLGGWIDFEMSRITGGRVAMPTEAALGKLEHIQNQYFDRLTWDYLHFGMKLAVGLREFEKAVQNHPEMPKEEIARQVASYTNDLFGGLDWYKVAAESQTAAGRWLAMHTFSPKGRVALQLGMFAPDWTLSTFRSIYKALPGSAEGKLTQRLHAKYVARAGLLLGVLQNALNYQTSGHSLWQNKDPTRLEFKDGTSMQLLKHATEFIELVRDPMRVMGNKINPLLAEVPEQIMRKDYLSSNMRSVPPMGSRLGHALGKIAPINLGELTGPSFRTPAERAKRAALTTFGPIKYGVSKTERDKLTEQRKEKKLDSLFSDKPRGKKKHSILDDIE